MKVTERQEKILNRVIQDYINLAQPISSEFLEKKYDFGICPATIRIEMKKLTDDGFLQQPHTSAGRVPTDKGYRLFVDQLLTKEFFEKNKDFSVGEGIEEEISDPLFLIQSLTKNLAHFSSSLALSYLTREKLLWKEGWEEILREPEFEEKKFVFNFADFLDNLEENITELKTDSGIKIYIGKENPFTKAKDFSIIFSVCELEKENDQAIFALLGPKRMAYDKNISLINSLTKLLDNF